MRTTAVNIGVQSAGTSYNTVINDDLSLADSWADYNFAQAETAAAVTEFEQQAEAAAAVMELEQVEIAAVSASQADGKSRPLKGGRGGRGRERPPKRGTCDKVYIKPGRRYNYLRARLAGNSYG